MTEAGNSPVPEGGEGDHDGLSSRVRDGDRDACRSGSSGSGRIHRSYVGRRAKRPGPRARGRQRPAEVASWERCCDPEEVAVAKRKSVYSALHQTHLPYLEERGLVAFDRETNEIEWLLENSEVDLSLAADPRKTVRWYRVYLLLAGVSGPLPGSVWAGLPAFARVPPIALAVVLVSSYAATSVAHWYDVHRWRRCTDGMVPISSSRSTTLATGPTWTRKGPERRCGTRWVDSHGPSSAGRPPAGFESCKLITMEFVGGRV